MEDFARRVVAVLADPRVGGMVRLGGPPPGGQLQLGEVRPLLGRARDGVPVACAQHEVPGVGDRFRGSRLGGVTVPVRDQQRVTAVEVAER